MNLGGFTIGSASYIGASQHQQWLSSQLTLPILRKIETKVWELKSTLPLFQFRHHPVHPFLWQLRFWSFQLVKPKFL